METELLSPAGDIEAGYAAFHYGADAVYLGLNRFSARAEAVNFTQQELDALTAYAHSIDKKVYVALNTLIQESELADVLKALQECVDCHVDAVIVQDIGIARLVRKYFPSLQLHASTQMAIHNLEGALFLKKMGFSRVVLARELSLKEIEQIRDKSGLETEVFIHGALCYSYSGLCQFSSLETARSANRGKCVYACRDMFHTDHGSERLFSMKDLALETDVLKLKGCSLKIEGRKKNALYVAAVTHYYRTILNTGKNDVKLTDNLKQIFARPWTKLHFNGKNKDVFASDFSGHRGLKIGTVEKVAAQKIIIRPNRTIARYDGIQIDTATDKPFGFSLEHIKVNNRSVFSCSAGQQAEITIPPHHPFIEKGAAVYLSSSSLVKGSYPYQKPKPGMFKNRIPVDLDVFISPESIVVCGNDVREMSNGSFSLAKDPKKTEQSIQSCFEKNKDTPFVLRSMTVHNPDGLFVPMTVLNDLRRRFYNALPIQKEALPELRTSLLQAALKQQKPRFIVKTDQPACLKKLPMEEIDEFLIEITPNLTLKQLEFLPIQKIRLAVPLIIRQGQWLKNKIDSFVKAGINQFEVSNFGGLFYLPKNADVSFDSLLSVLNTQSFQMALELNASRITFSIEDTCENIAALAQKSDKTALIVYQDVPLFISANCVRKNDCSSCDKIRKSEKINTKKGTFEMISQFCQTTVFDQRPFSITSYDTIPAGAYRIDFCHKLYTSDQVSDIWTKVKNKQHIPNSFSGNFHKKFA